MGLVTSSISRDRNWVRPSHKNIRQNRGYHRGVGGAGVRMRVGEGVGVGVSLGMCVGAAWVWVWVRVWPPKPREREWTSGQDCISKGTPHACPLHSPPVPPKQPPLRSRIRTDAPEYHVGLDFLLTAMILLMLTIVVLGAVIVVTANLRRRLGKMKHEHDQRRKRYLEPNSPSGSPRSVFGTQSGWMSFSGPLPAAIWRSLTDTGVPGPWQSPLRMCHAVEVQGAPGFRTRPAPLQTPSSRWTRLWLISNILGAFARRRRRKVCFGPAARGKIFFTLCQLKTLNILWGIRKNI